MIKRKMILGIIAVMCISSFTACGSQNKEGRQVIEKSDKTIVVKANNNEDISGEVTVDKIESLEGIRGEEWIDDNKILFTKENKELKPIDTGIGVHNIRNLYSFNLQSKEEKCLVDKSQDVDFIGISPDKKHIMYVNIFENKKLGNEMGYIIDVKGNKKLQIQEPYGSDMICTKWIGNEQVIMPYKASGVYLGNINGKSSIIQEIEKYNPKVEFWENMIYYVVKVGDKLYYVTYDKKIVSYDIKTKEKKVIKENALDFELSPNKNQFAIVREVEKDKHSLILTDLEGKNEVVIVDEGRISDTSWSPDQKKIAYSVVKDNAVQKEQGVFVTDIDTQKSYQISVDYRVNGDGIKWSPSGKKMIVNRNESKDGSDEWIESAYIITLK
ncbi:hypothetical protein [Clostridium ganghwense]|uniref:Lipoprotein n=1 Tax=Clostridium ganghwense TaxID=312089 RepID=A0ABT4CK75_9CLOT|nr:hypothetical protein [Clostridium ganghwense]MCY6369450.1 hypothetical protein [Clostridium ganghwense]